MSFVEPVSVAGPGRRLLVVGCGGIGGIVAAHLFEQGHDVTALTTNAHIADAINAHGFRVRGEGSPGTVRGRAVREIDPKSRPFDYILLATQPPQVEEAARRALPFLAPEGAMVCLQNGLCEERVGAIAGPDRTLGAIVAWGASTLEPGVYDRTSAGGFVLGRLDGAPDPRLDELARILEAIGPTSQTQNLIGARWSKLAINCNISSIGTVGGDRLGVLMRHRHVRRLGLEIMTEVVEVARALGVRLEKVSGTLDLDWIALTESERHAAGSPGLFAKHALLLAVGARYRRLRSSMLAAIERGRPPAVDFLNGEVVARGAALGIPTPINAAIRDQVMDIAKRKATPGLALLRALFDRTRGIVNAPAEPVSIPIVIQAVEPTLMGDFALRTTEPAGEPTVAVEPASQAAAPAPEPEARPTLDMEAPPAAEPCEPGKPGEPGEPPA